MSGDDCPECDGEGKMTTVHRKDCDQCDGAGSVPDGRFSRFVCPKCAGEGGKDRKDDKTCTRCKGTGSRRRKTPPPAGVIGTRVANGDPAPKSKAKAQARSTDGSGPEPVAPAAGAAAGAGQNNGDDDDVESAELKSGSRDPNVKYELNINLSAVGTVFAAVVSMVGVILIAKGKEPLSYVVGALLCIIGSALAYRLQANKCAEFIRSAQAGGG